MKVICLGNVGVLTYDAGHRLPVKSWNRSNGGRNRVINFLVASAIVFAIEKILSAWLWGVFQEILIHRWLMARINPIPALRQLCVGLSVILAVSQVCLGLV